MASSGRVFFYQQNRWHHERNFEVTDTKRAILSVHKGCGNGSVIEFTPHRRGKIINRRCIEHLVLGTTPGFDIVYDRRAHVTDVDVNDGGQQSKNNAGIAFSVIRTEHWDEPRAARP